MAARRDGWKICRVANKPWQLFHIADDIGEHHDLAKQHPERVSQMVSEVEKWSQGHTEPQWFDSLKVRDQWNDADMPRYEKTFQID